MWQYTVETRSAMFRELVEGWNSEIKYHYENMPKYECKILLDILNEIDFMVKNLSKNQVKRKNLTSYYYSILGSLLEEIVEILGKYDNSATSVQIIVEKLKDGKYLSRLEKIRKKIILD